jgi:[NiFe] hydrogenase diaphorase moiety small subunit
MSDSRTPAGRFTIDGKAVPFNSGQTIMEAAQAAGVYIPHLCYQPGYQPHGSCKLCTVEVGARRVAACTTQAENGMVVANDTPALNDDRRALTEMLFVEGNHICPACEKTGNCQLQAVGYYLGMTALRFEHFYPPRSIDATHPDIVLDRNRCILCELCVRASRDVDGKNVFGIGGRGIHSRVIVNAASGRLGDTDLALDDAAAHVCPVGAILIKREAYKVPIGRRIYDGHPISEVALADARAKREGGDD